ncbi:hypothetical protein AAMO2058_000759300 [Amorphochlora amoebiformis]
MVGPIARVVICLVLGWGVALHSEKTQDCDAINPICERSDACFALDLVRETSPERAKLDHHHHSNVYIASDNIKDPEEVPNFSETARMLRGKHLRIRSVLAWMDNAGFYTYPLLVINQLRFAEKLGLIGSKKPFVYMPETHHYFTHCSKGAPNFWEKWFEPISSVDYKDLADNQIWEFNQATIQNMHHDWEAVHAYPYDTADLYVKGDVGTQQWVECMRKRAEPTIQRYIAVKQDVMNQAQWRYSKLFPSGSEVMAIHLRGTDKWITNIVQTSSYIDVVEKYLGVENKNRYIFLATEDSRMLEEIRRYVDSERLIYHPAMRGTTGDNPFYNDTLRYFLHTYVYHGTVYNGI